MIFSKSIIEIIQERTSWRTYSNRAIEKEKKEQLNEIISLNQFSSPFSSFAGNCRFELVNLPELDPRERRKLGTYGFIKGAQDFIVGAIEESNYNRENYGYLMEAIILAATDMGLGTCWLGGTFNRSLFSARINCKPNEIVPAITPIGYTPENRRFKERMIRRVAKANSRYQWESLFFEGNFNNPLTQEQAGEYITLLEMVRLGPSAGNKQPWRIIKESDNKIYHFYVRKSKDKIGIIYSRFAPLDIGIAVCHFDLIAKELKMEGHWEIQQPEINEFEGLEYIISWYGT